MSASKSLGGVLFAMTVAVVAASLAAGFDASAAEYVGAEMCGACHTEAYEAWAESIHAKAFSSSFEYYWEKIDRNPDCLVCHTTGFDRVKLSYAEKGVSCEACHGPLSEDHPDNLGMSLAVESESCKDCHLRTYQEWQISGHAKAGLRCFDCHQAHGQGLRYSQAEGQCAACHAQRMEDFVHSSHHMHGLKCTSCHMPMVKSTGIGGTGAPGHTFFVGAETCAACHDDNVHSSHQLPSFREQVKQLSGQALAEHVDDLQAQIKTMELRLDAERNRRVKWAVGALIVGLALGLWLFGRERNGRGRSKQS